MLYGHEIDEETTPWEAGLEWVVKLEKGAFMGSDALASSLAPPRRLIGFVSETRAIPARAIRSLGTVIHWEW